MKLDLAAIPRETTLSKEDFIKRYFKPQQPVIIEKLVNDWPAFQKWNFDYMDQVAGEIEVPLYDDRPVKHDEGFNEPHAKMKMSEYIGLLRSGPTKYRIFLWNILKEVPQLQRDYAYPDLGLKIMKGLPMLFFGGSDSYTFMHYDIDLANIFHFHFEGKKRCTLFAPDQTKHLYKVPHSLITREDIDFSDPDLKKWPALRNAKGFVGDLEHGNVLYIPEGYWHYMRYLTPGFSMSLRSVPKRPANLFKAIYNIVVMRNYDNLMRKWKGQGWIDWKNQQAIDRTHRLLTDK